MDDRAERPTGLLAALRDVWARVRAAEPEPPANWRPPRGLGSLNDYLDQVRAASGVRAGVLNPKAQLADGYEYRAIPAMAWARSAEIELAVAVLAWLLAGEAEDMKAMPQYGWAIGEAAINAARAIQRTGESLEGAIVRRCTGDARFAEPHFGTQRGGRWASTWQQPTGRHVRCAELLLERARANAPALLAAGAVQWLDPLTQHNVHVGALKAAAMAKEAGDELAFAKAMRKAEGNPPPEVVTRRRYASGRRWIGPRVDALGTVILDPFRLLLYAAEGVGLDETLAAIADGRRRWKRPA